MTTLPSAHSPAGASGAERWIPCPGSVPLGQDVEQTTSVYAAEGSFAHHHAAEVLEEKAEAWELEGTKGEQDGFEFTVDEEMVAGISRYVEECQKLGARLPKKNAAQYVEHPFHHPDKIHPLFYGTCDYGFVDPPELHVIDFKYGKGKLVEPKENAQLMYYALGLYYELPAALQKKVKTVKLTIVQPRIDWHPDGVARSWECKIDVLLAWEKTVLKPAFDKIEAMLSQKEPTENNLKTGSWCHWCPARKKCPLLKEAFVQRVEQAASGVDPATLENWEIAEIIQQKAVIMAFFKMVEEEDFTRQMKGEEIPGRKLVEKKSNRVFKDGAQEELFEALGDAIFLEPKLKTPPQIEKLGAKAKKLVAKLAYKPHTGLTSVDESDSKPAVRRSTKDVFADIDV